MEYQDPRTLTDLQVVWRGVELVPTWWELVVASPYWKSLWCLLIPTLLLLLAMGKNLRVRSWVPVAVPLTEVLFASRFPEPLKVEPLELAGVAGASFVAVLLAGLAAPPLFRELALVQPFRLIAPAALRLTARAPARLSGLRPAPASAPQGFPR